MPLRYPPLERIKIPYERDFHFDYYRYGELSKPIFLKSVQTVTGKQFGSAAEDLAGLADGFEYLAVFGVGPGDASVREAVDGKGRIQITQRIVQPPGAEMNHQWQVSRPPFRSQSSGGPYFCQYSI
jgi:hypothetical protein